MDHFHESVHISLIYQIETQRDIPHRETDAVECEARNRRFARGLRPRILVVGQCMPIQRIKAADGGGVKWNLGNRIQFALVFTIAETSKWHPDYR